MSDGSTVVKLDNVSYGSFPTACELIQLSSNLVLSFIDFIRTIGVNSRDQMAKYFRSPPEEVNHLCLKCHLNPEANQSSIERSVESRRIWQREILGGSTQHVKVNLKEILQRARKRSSFYKIDAFSKEVRYFFISFLRRNSVSQVLPKGTINQKRVKEILSNCHIRPIRSWEKARMDFDYVCTLMIEAFPHTPVPLMSEYLFTEDKPLPQHITYYCSHHGINHPHMGYSTPIYREEQIAFIKWTGHNVKEFIASQAEKDASWRRYL